MKTRTEFWVKAVKKTMQRCSSSVTDPSGTEAAGTGTTSTVSTPMSTPAGNVASYQRAEMFVISALLFLLLPVMKLVVGRH